MSSSIQERLTFVNWIPSYLSEFLCHFSSLSYHFFRSKIQIIAPSFKKILPWCHPTSSYSLFSSLPRYLGILESTVYTCQPHFLLTFYSLSLESTPIGFSSTNSSCQGSQLVTQWLVLHLYLSCNISPTDHSFLSWNSSLAFQKTTSSRSVLLLFHWLLLFTLLVSPGLPDL